MLARKAHRAEWERSGAGPPPAWSVARGRTPRGRRALLRDAGARGGGEPRAGRRAAGKPVMSTGERAHRPLAPRHGPRAGQLRHRALGNPTPTVAVVKLHVANGTRSPPEPHFLVGSRINMQITRKDGAQSRSNGHEGPSGTRNDIRGHKLDYRAVPAGRGAEPLPAGVAPATEAAGDPRSFNAQEADAATTRQARSFDLARSNSASEIAPLSFSSLSFASSSTDEAPPAVSRT